MNQKAPQSQHFAAMSQKAPVTHATPATQNPSVFGGVSFRWKQPPPQQPFRADVADYAAATYASPAQGLNGASVYGTSLQPGFGAAAQPQAFGQQHLGQQGLPEVRSLLR